MPKGIYQRLSVETRFWMKVKKTNDCWLWTAKLFGGGYGSLRVKNKRTLAHRVSWVLHHGDIPSGLEVCHTCDIRHCVNPSHLFLGTAQDNTQDAVRKGRHPFGEKQGRAKLTEAEVRRIRELYAAGMTGAELMRQYHVASRTMWDILQRKHWKHVA